MKHSKLLSDKFCIHHSITFCQSVAVITNFFIFFFKLQNSDNSNTVFCIALSLIVKIGFLRSKELNFKVKK